MFILAQPSVTTRWETQFELARWTVGAGLVVGVALVAAGLYAIIWMYRREGRGNLTQRGRIALTAIRCALLLLIGLIALEPVLARYQHRHVRATTLVLIDDSASMAVRDRYRNASDQARVVPVVGSVPESGVSRIDVARQFLAREQTEWLRRLAAKNRVEVFRFSDRAAPLKSREPANDSAEDAETPPASTGSDGPATDPTRWQLRAAGPATDVGRAVREAVGSLGGAPAAAVIVLSDGGLNQGEPPDAIGRFLESRGVPLYAVGLGDPAEPVNVRVTEVIGPRHAFARDPFSVTVQVAAEGIDSRPLSVELLRLAPGGDADSAVLVDRRDVAPDENGVYPPLSFECRVNEAGPVVFTARVPLLPDEAVETDNARDTLPPVDVLDGRMRLLLVAGGPSYEYRFLTRLLERDETVDVSCWLQSAGTRAVRDGDIVIDHLPQTAEELAAYDVFILVDPNPAGLPPEWPARVATQIDDFGRGMLFAADSKWTSVFLRDPRMQPLLDLLPVVFDSEAELIINQLGRYQRAAWPLVIPPESAGSPLLRQADAAAASLEAWSRLEGVFWHYPVRREKPAATVLLRHGNPRMAGPYGPHVLYAVQYAGSGRTAWLGFNSTWRWQRYGPEYFERFWIQAIRYLMEGKLLGGKQRGVIMTDQDQFNAGDTVVVTLRALDERFEPVTVPSIDLEVVQSDEAPRTVVLTATPGREGFYQGRFVVDRVGPVRISATLPGGAGAPAAVQRDLVVRPADLELRRPVMRRDLLRRLAESSGGRYFEIDEASAAPDLIEDRGESSVIRERPRPLWDNGYVFALLILLVTAEWIGRKRAKLL